MKKAIPLTMILFTILACTISLPGSSFEEDVSTQVALAMTETVLQSTVENQNTTPSPSESQETSAPTATQTPPADDPKTLLGDADFKDDLSSGKNWNLQGGAVDVGNTNFSVANGKLTAVNSSQFNWWLTHLSFKNAYLEAKFDVEDCAGNDQYGLMIRAADYGDGIAYYLSVTCDGSYELHKETSGGSSVLIGLTASDVINSGSNQTNTLGIWADGSTIRLYINNQFLKEVDDSSIQADGHFGLFLYGAQTPGFTLHMDEISYWLLDE